MKRVFYALLLFGTALFAETKVENIEVNTSVPVVEEKAIAATRGDIKVIEASEHIRYLSQKMAREYLLFYLNQDKTELKKDLSKTLGSLSNNLRIIAVTTKDSDTKDILEFLAYSKDQIEEMFKGNADEEKAALMLDYSETLLEGADSIANAHSYDFSDEEKMLMVAKKLEYLLERTMKYYMAINAGFNNPTNKEQLQLSMDSIDENMKQIDHYSYASELKVTQAKMNRSWKANKVFLDRSENLFIPMLMFLSVNHMENILEQISIYHTQNL